MIFLCFQEVYLPVKAQTFLRGRLTLANFLEVPSTMVGGFLIFNFQNKRLCMSFFFSYLVSEWVTLFHKIIFATPYLGTWYISDAYFTVKKKTLLIWSLWSRLYSSLNFLRKQSCVVNRFVLEKSLELFCLCFSLWQVSHLCLLYDNAHRQFIFILFLRFSIAGENKDGCRNGVWSVDAAMALGTPKK